MLGVMKLVPLPNTVPPVGKSYQLSVPALAAAPRINVPASQREFGVMAVMVGTVLIVAVTPVLVDVQLPVVASTKYVVVPEMDGEILVPVAMNEPPIAAVYQFNVPALAVAEIVTEPLPHRFPGVVAVTVGVVLTVAITAVLGEMQLPLTAST